MLKQVRISGFGGQGVVLAGTILGEAAAAEGRWVAGSSSYGAQARGGYARADVVISDKPIVYPRVMDADLLVAMSQSAYDRYTAQLAPGALVIYDETLVNPREIPGATQVPVAATALALKNTGARQAANMVMLGALAEMGKIVGRKVLAKVVESRSGAFKEANLKALELGFALGEGR